MVEDFDSRPHNAVTSHVERNKELQAVRELNLPTKALPGHSSGKMLRRSKIDGGKKDGEEDDEVRQLEKE